MFCLILAGLIKKWTSEIMTIQTLIGLMGSALFLALLVLKIELIFISKMTDKASVKVALVVAILVSIVVFILSFIPFSGTSINQYIRGILNDLSISSLVLILAFFFRIFLLSRGKRQSKNKNKFQPLFILLALWGVFFYLGSLGFGPIDPYSWGFINQQSEMLIPILLLLIVFTLMLYAFIARQVLLLICLVASVLAFQLGLLESRNIWDYLFDPLLVIYAMIVSIKFYFSRSIIYFAKERKGSAL
jgi:hypothetical protein